MKIREHKREVMMIVLTVVIAFITWYFVVKLYTENIETMETAEYENVFINSATDLELVINQTVTYIYGLRGFTYSQLESGISEEEFLLYSKETQEYAFSIKNFSIAPGNIQTFVYPMKGNEVTLGHNLITDERENVRNDVTQAMETGNIVISGPYELRQGGLGMVVRTPIYKDEEYWGLINVVVDVDSIIEKSKISDLDNNISYSIADKNNNVFWGNEGDFANSTIYKTIELIEDRWIIAGRYKPHFFEKYTNRLNLFILISFIGFAMVATSVVNGIYRNILLSSKVKSLIYNDVLTELPNRRALKELLEKHVKKETVFGLAFLDLDNFKNINDTLGHSFGDEVLKIISKRFMKYVGEGLNVYRWGGDEFIIIADNITSHSELKEKIKVMVASIEIPIKVISEEYSITLSAGLCIYPFDGTTIEEIIKYADITMYHAKGSGKNKIEIYTSSISEEIYRQLDIEYSLIKALDNDELMVYYQPQVDLESNKIVGAEALVRWKDENNNYISPSVFIPIAEKCGLITRIDKFVFNKAVEQLSIWNSMGFELKVSINISAAQFNSDIYPVINEKLKEYDISPSKIEIEITETTAIKNLIQAQKLIRTLKTININVALDDFGTGYSSLSYLSKLNISTLKIDQSFIAKVIEDSYERKIVKSVIGLGKEIGLIIVAEGVENKEQLEYLKSIGCNVYQGFYFSKAVNAKEFENLLNLKS